MANQQIKRLFRRRPEIEEAEFELLQSRVLARLTGANEDIDEPTEGSDAGDGSDAVAAEEGAVDGHATAGPDEPAQADGHLVPGRVTTYEPPAVVAGATAEPGDPPRDGASDAIAADDIPATASDIESTAPTDAEPVEVAEPAEVAEPVEVAEPEPLLVVEPVKLEDPDPFEVAPAPATRRPGPRRPPQQPNALRV